MTHENLDNTEASNESNNTMDHNINEDIIDYGALNGTEPAPLPVKTPDDDYEKYGKFSSLNLVEQTKWLETQPPLSWLLEGLMTNEDYTLIAAEAKAGKTWLAMMMAISFATGTKFLNRFKAKKTKVLYLCGEGSLRMMHRRLQAIAKDAGMTGYGQNICFNPKVPNLTKELDLDQIGRLTRDIEAGVVILDPLYLAMGGVGQSQLAEVGALLDALQTKVAAAGATLIVVDHWNKNGAGSGFNRATGAGKTEWARLLGSMRTTTDHGTTSKPDENGEQFTWTDKSIEIEFTGGNIGHERVQFRRQISSKRNDLTGPISYNVNYDTYDPGEPSPEEKRVSGIRAAYIAEANRNPNRVCTKSDWVETVKGGRRQVKMQIFDELADRGLFIEQGEGRGRLFSVDSDSNYME